MTPAGEAGRVFVPVTFRAYCIRASRSWWSRRVHTVYEALELQTRSDGGVVDAPCDGGVLDLRLYPSIGFPVEISPPPLYAANVAPPRLNDSSLSCALTGCPQPNATGIPSSELYGPAKTTGYVPVIAYPTAYPYLKYEQARFSLRAAININNEGDALWDGLFTYWDSQLHSPVGVSCQHLVTVGCGDSVEVRMGNEGQEEFWTTFRITGY